MPRNARMFAATTLSIALIAGACSSASPSIAPAADVPGSPTSATPAPTVEPTRTPPQTPARTPAPSPSLAPSPTPAATPAEVVTVNAVPVWAFDKPLTLKGTAGTHLWTTALLAARTISLRWSGTPADREGCRLAYTLEATSPAKTVKGSDKTTNAKSLSGRRNVLIKYATGQITVKTDCAKWTLKVVPTGHPGIILKRDTDTTRTTATTAYGLNDALSDSHIDWWLNTSYKYMGTNNPRVASKTITLDVTYELPKWSAPEGTDPQLVSDWKAALAGMKRHEQGEAAIAMQAAGRYLASLTKSRFTSKKAMEGYFDAKGDKWIEWSNDRIELYDELTDWGGAQGAFID
jgi:hypothetical protein